MAGVVSWAEGAIIACRAVDCPLRRYARMRRAPGTGPSNVLVRPSALIGSSQIRARPDAAGLAVRGHRLCDRHRAVSADLGETARRGRLLSHPDRKRRE